MDLGQWAYWATAVPVTLLVLVLGLWFTGEFEALGRWVGSWFGGAGVGGCGVWGLKKRGEKRGGYVEGAGGKGEVVVVDYDDDGWDGDGEERRVGRGKGRRAWRGEVRKRRSGVE
jgi:hypothetical protein